MNYVQDAFTVQVGRITNGPFLPLLELPRTFRFFIHVLSSHSNRTKRVICDIICLFVWCFSSHARNFHSYGDVTIAGFDLCSALMSIEHWGFFKVPQVLWHGHPFIMGTPKDPWHSHILPSVWQRSCHYLFLRLRPVAVGVRTPNLPHMRWTL